MSRLAVRREITRNMFFFSFLRTVLYTFFFLVIPTLIPFFFWLFNFSPLSCVCSCLFLARCAFAAAE